MQTVVRTSNIVVRVHTDIQTNHVLHKTLPESLSAGKCKANTLSINSLRQVNTKHSWLKLVPLWGSSGQMSWGKQNVVLMSFLFTNK